MDGPTRRPHGWRLTVPAHLRGYGGRHRRIRRDLLREEPNCRECKREGKKTPATHADHVKPLCLGGGTERTNYQPLCERHSRSKAGREGAYCRHTMKGNKMTRYLVGKIGAREAWAAIDTDSLCTAPNIAERKFVAFMSPFQSEGQARAALTDAGATDITERKAKPDRRGDRRA